jgi:hypothetical protein
MVVDKTADITVDFDDALMTRKWLKTNKVLRSDMGMMSSRPFL